MKDALMKYETIDAPQIDDLMNRVPVREPAGWEGDKPKADTRPPESSNRFRFRKHLNHQMTTMLRRLKTTTSSHNSSFSCMKQ